jgi:hypothetical protein
MEHYHHHLISYTYGTFNTTQKTVTNKALFISVQSPKMRPHFVQINKQIMLVSSRSNQP